MDCAQNAEGEKKTGWSPEEYGFKKKFDGADFWEKGFFELHPGKHDRWLCRRRVKNRNGNTEYLVRFFLPIDKKEVAEYLLTRGLE